MYFIHCIVLDNLVRVVSKLCLVISSSVTNFWFYSEPRKLNKTGIFCFHKIDMGVQHCLLFWKELKVRSIYTKGYIVGEVR